jgi:Spy/CpxP family protein refolding chaperone
MGHPFDPGGGPFGVRRPLRFLAHKLDLDEKQVAEIAKVLDDLKTERAQAAVDDRRAAAAFAESLEADSFDADGVAKAGAQRVASAERLRDAVTRALQRMHALLRPEQRAHLATMIRTGVVTI